MRREGAGRAVGRGARGMAGGRGIPGRGGSVALVFGASLTSASPASSSSCSHLAYVQILNLDSKIFNCHLSFGGNNFLHSKEVLYRERSVPVRLQKFNHPG